MSPEAADELAAFLRDQVGDNLRSIAYYDDGDYEVVYLRDDVADQYTENEQERVGRDVRLESVAKGHQEDLYVHGSLQCTVRVFEDAVEMHFAFEDGTGVTAALDAESLTAQRTFVGRCLEVAGAR